MSGFDFNAYCASHRTVPMSKYGMYGIIPRIECKDGLSLSVQADKYAYCTPRAALQQGYSHVEVGFPSAPVDELMHYAEDASNPTGTVYGYVPVEVVEGIVNAHGGSK